MTRRLLLIPLLVLLLAASTAEDRKNLANTLQWMRVIDEAIQLYGADRHDMPKVSNIRELARVLAPEYVRELPIKDAYGHDYMYTTGSFGYRIVSHGDGTREITLENGRFTDQTLRDGYVPWHPYDAPLAKPSGTNRNLEKLARSVNRSHARVAKADMNMIATAVEAYATDFNHYPIAHTVGELTRLIVPAYAKSVPYLDPWQTPYRYASNDNGTNYTIYCAGADLDMDRGFSPETPEVTDNYAKDAILHNGKFLRAWATDDKTALTPPPPPPAATIHTPLRWTFDIVQDGAVVAPKDGVVTLRRAPFTIRVTSDQTHDVRLNALGDDRVYQRMKVGFDFRSCATDIVALCNGTALAEEDHNPRKRLMLNADAMHYLADDRWDRTSMTDSGFVMERDVAMLGDTPIASSTLRDLYLTAVIWSNDTPILTEDALRKVHIRFR